MATESLTDMEVELEIERLCNSDAVKLAKKEQYFRNKRRQYMYTLRWYEKRGKELIEQGMSLKDYDFSDTEKCGIDRNE